MAPLKAWNKLGLLTGLGGIVSIWTAHKARRSFGCYADTAFEHHPNIRDLPASPAYHLVNNFWLPQAHHHHGWNTEPATALPLHFIGQFHNQPTHLAEGQDLPPDDFDHGDSFGLLSTGSAVVGSTLFHHGYGRKHSIREAVTKARRLLKKHMQEIGAPGLVVGVSIDGHMVWTEGLGYSDFENGLACQADTVMRIASISKAISMTIVAKLWEQGLLDLDKPVQEYVPDFPLKTFEGQPVTITCRQLVSHLSGIRHYSKTKKSDEEYSVDPPKNIDQESKKEKKPTVLAKYNEFDEKEYYLKEFFPKVSDALKLFQDDPILVEPGTEFLYTTYGWTLLSAVIESVTKRKFTDNLKDVLRDFDMTNTFLDEHEPIIHNRARNYRRDKLGRLKNAPYVDNSYKWAGGGLVSTVGDLLKFAHLMLYAAQVRNPSDKPGFLKAETLEKMWTLVDHTKKNKFVENGYGMGWMVVPERWVGGWCLQQPHVVYHTGGAIGASSVLTLLPREKSDASWDEFHVVRDVPKPPQGIVVTLVVNLEQASLYKKSVEIAQLFDRVDIQQ